MREKISGIYGIHNTMNNKWYIGQSGDCLGRWNWHRLRLEKRTHTNTHLQRAWTKHTPDGFQHILLEQIEDAIKRDAAERKWIRHFRSNRPLFGYNLDSGGCAFKKASKRTLGKMQRSTRRLWKSVEYRKAVMRGIQRSPVRRDANRRRSEAMRKLWADPSNHSRWSAQRKEVWARPEVRLHQSQAQQNRPSITAATRQRISKALKGRTLSPEWKERVRLGVLARGYRHTPEAKRRIALAVLGRKDSKATRLRKARGAKRGWEKRYAKAI